MHHPKVRIAHKYKGDFSIIQQEIDEAIKRGLKEFEEQENSNGESTLNQYQDIIHRRIQEYYLNCYSEFRQSVQYCKKPQKDAQRIVMSPDANLQKINDVKLSMLKEVVAFSKTQKFQQIPIPIETSLPQKIEVVHCESYQQNIEDLEKRLMNSMKGYQQRIKAIKNLQNLTVNTIRKIELQQKKDKSEIEKFQI